MSGLELRISLKLERYIYKCKNNWYSVFHCKLINLHEDVKSINILELICTVEGQRFLVLQLYLTIINYST